jgi:membrane fusion protein (multidrug efflux system)
MEAIVTQKQKRRIAGTVVVVVLGAFSFFLVSHGKTTAGEAARSAPEVEVANVEQKDIPVYREWVGTLDGLVNAAIRAQVTGYLLTQNYAEGSFVKKGQLLFEIDPRPLQAAADQARGQLAQANGQLAQAQAQFEQSNAQLASAEANQRKAQFDEDRYTPLAKQHAVTQQDLDNAVQNNVSAKAQIKVAAAQVEAAKAQIQAASAAVEAAKATLEAANVNLGFTKLSAPIDGIAGEAQIQIGNLVSPAANAVTTVSTLDPIKVTFAISEQEYLRLTKQRKPKDPVPPLELILADGSVYPQEGKFAFTGRQVNQSTGAIEVTGLFPNPGNVLRPGQYGKVRVAVETLHDAVLVPQQAVSELQGSYQVATVDQDDKVAILPIRVGEQIGSSWVVQEGVKPGQRVIIEGIQKVSPGMRVSPKMAHSMAKVPE